MLFDINLSNFFDMSPQARETITKRNKWDDIKLKCFCMVKKTFNKMKKLPTKWEKIFANNTSDKGLISKIYKELLTQHEKNKTNLSKNWENNLNRHFYKEDIQMANRQTKRCSTSLIIREKNRMRYHLTPVTMAIIKKTTNNM